MLKRAALYCFIVISPVLIHAAEQPTTATWSVWKPSTWSLPYLSSYTSVQASSTATSSKNTLEKIAHHPPSSTTTALTTPIPPVPTHTLAAITVATSSTQQAPSRKGHDFAPLLMVLNAPPPAPAQPIQQTQSSKRSQKTPSMSHDIVCLPLSVWNCLKCPCCEIVRLQPVSQ